MTNLDNALAQLREEHDRAQQYVGKLREAISALEGIVGHSSTAASSGARPKRTLSASARKKIAAAQRARWAKVREQQKVVPIAQAPKKRTMSASARRKIAAAQRARWAKVKKAA